MKYHEGCDGCESRRDIKEFIKSEVENGNFSKWAHRTYRVTQVYGYTISVAMVISGCLSAWTRYDVLRALAGSSGSDKYYAIMVGLIMFWLVRLVGERVTASFVIRRERALLREERRLFAEERKELVKEWEENVIKAYQIAWDGLRRERNVDPANPPRLRVVRQLNDDDGDTRAG
ncbi:hypothetical protein [Streptomyces sp. Z26]|uniref:hypothetical protein n=1 Tax=Streptomyces sp. Z26 TaxID=2500177 RepID=UPI000EF17383|nr:hypothetical protein [Streptomyces sp. Z26]RLL68169.1 hypothetical protein D7M15_16445 [Streptomyces sp. Z26]